MGPNKLSGGFVGEKSGDGCVFLPTIMQLAQYPNKVLDIMECETQETL